MHYTIKNDKQSKYSFFEFFVELILDWLDKGVIDGIFVATPRCLKDAISLQLEDLKLLEQVKTDYRLMFPLLRKCANHIYSYYEDSELPIHYIADSYQNNNREIALPYNEFFGEELSLVKSTESPLLQVADFLAYSYNRFLSSDGDEEFKKIFEPIMKLIKC